MRRAVTLLVALAACSEEGVFIEVRVPVPADEVELFFGVDECGADTCDHLAPEGQAANVRGRILFRDADAALSAPVDADGSAWFKLAVTPDVVPAVIAVATAAGTDEPVAVGRAGDLELGRTRHVVIESEAAAPWSFDDSTQVPHGARLWPERQCVGAADESGRVTFIVRAGDPDCDEVDPALECDELTYLADRPGVVGPCAAPAVVEVVPPSELCVLGSGDTSCTDGEVREEGCSRDGPIVDPEVCDCSGSNELEACVRDTYEVKLECTFVVRFVKGRFEACSASSGSGKPALLESGLAVDSCPTFVGFAESFTLLPTRDMFAPIIQPYSSGQLEALSISSVATTAGECVDAIKWSFQSPAETLPLPDSAQFWVWIELAGVPLPLLVPMTVDWVTDNNACVEPSTCVLEGDPRVGR